MITLKITPDDGPEYKVTATARDVLAWEKTTGSKKSFVDLINDPNLIDLYRVAHLACWRQGLIPKGMTQKQFEDSCEVTGGGEEADEEPDPTQSDLSADDSSDLPSEPASPRPSGRKKANAQS